MLCVCHTLCQKLTLCGGCRRESLQQTLRHARGKHTELSTLSDTIKVLSPASDTSTLEAVPVSAVAAAYGAAAPPASAHGGAGAKAAPSRPASTHGGTPGSAAREHAAIGHAHGQPAHSSAQGAYAIAQELDNAVSRLQGTVNSVVELSASAPKLRMHLAAFMNEATRAKCGVVARERARSRLAGQSWRAAQSLVGMCGAALRRCRTHVTLSIC